MTTIRTEEPHYCSIEINHEEDWYDAIPQMVHPVTGTPFDLADVTLELYIRPVYDHSVLVKKLTSASSAGILIESAAEGLASIYLPKDMVDNLPIGEWDQFLRMLFTNPPLVGTLVKTIWRGPILIKPGRVDG